MTDVGHILHRKESGQSLFGGCDQAGIVEKGESAGQFFDRDGCPHRQGAAGHRPVKPE